MNVISPKLKFVMKIVFKPITTSALLSDDQKMPTLDSFWYMTSHLYLYVSPALGCCRLIWLHMVSCIMARDPHVSSPASVLKLGCNIHLLMKPGQRKNRCFYIFCEIEIFLKNYSFRIQMMLQVFIFMLLIIFFISQ